MYISHNKKWALVGGKGLAGSPTAEAERSVGKSEGGVGAEQERGREGRERT